MKHGIFTEAEFDRLSPEGFHINAPSARKPAHKKFVNNIFSIFRDDTDDYINHSYQTAIHEFSHALGLKLNKIFRIDIDRTFPTKAYQEEFVSKGGFHTLTQSLRSDVLKESHILTDSLSRHLRTGLTHAEDEVVADMTADIVLKYFGFKGNFVSE